jgi:hypothetical protein
MTLGVCPPDLLGQNLVLDVDSGQGPAARTDPFGLRLTSKSGVYW